MNQEQSIMELFIPEFSEFDSIEEKHNFSKEYQTNKKKMIKEYRKSHITSVKTRYIKAATIILALVIASPFAVNATTDGELFNRIWGNDGKETIKSHEEVLVQEDKNSSTIITYPKREYVETDIDKAEKLIGENVSYEPIVTKIEDVTFTILSAVSDDNSAIIEYTLECENGVNVFNYSQLDNEAKGAWFTEESPFFYYYKDASSFIYVDLEKSTANKIYCYDYISFYNTLSSLTLEINKNGNIQKISIPLNETVSTYEYVNQDGGITEVSPISMNIDMTTGLGLSGDAAYDPINVYYVAIQYKDETQYIVLEHTGYNYTNDGTRQIIHESEVDIDNTSNVLGRMNGELSLVFNRLVDTDMIESITVNDITYILNK